MYIPGPDRDVRRVNICIVYIIYDLTDHQASTYQLRFLPQTRVWAHLSPALMRSLCEHMRKEAP